MADIIIEIKDGTYTCPDHPEVGPIAIGYAGDTAPTHVLVTHDENGLHAATPTEPPAAAAPTGDTADAATETATPPAADGAAAATSPGDGSQAAADSTGADTGGAASS